MAKLKTEHHFEGTVDDVFKGICDFPSYSEHLPGVTKIEVLAAKVEGSFCQVRYELNLIKKFYYILDMFKEDPSKLWWNLSESNIMEVNEGSWLLKGEKKNKTKATYSLEVKFKGLVPSAITDRIAKANLPAMMEGFQKIIDALKS